MTDQVSFRTFPEFFEWFEGYDLAMDVHGGNPYSPVWICGMEFGGGVTRLHRYVFHASEAYDIAGDTHLTDPSPSEYEYARLATEIVGCLTDKGLFDEFQKAYKDWEEARTRWNEIEEKYKTLDASGKKKLETGRSDAYGAMIDKDKAIRKLPNDWSMERKYFCANGHGFRMNAFPLSLPRNNDWDNTQVHYSENRLPLSVKDFIGVSLNRNPKRTDSIYKKIEAYSSRLGELGLYKQLMSDVFEPHVKKRLKKYKPRLVICTGRNYDHVFKKLFLTDKDSENRETVCLLNKLPHEKTNTGFELYQDAP